jgi:hypothetical protein
LRPVLAAATLSLLVAASGCGGGGTSKLSRDEATKSALDAASEQVADPSSELYEHRIMFSRATETGHANWVVRLTDTTSGRNICVSVMTAPGAITPTTNIAFSNCGSQRRVNPGSHPAQPGSAA